MTDQLKPCPLCGGTDLWYKDAFRTVDCQNDDCFMMAVRVPIEAWQLLPRPSEDAEALAQEIHLRIFEQDETDSDYLQIRKDEAIEWASRARRLGQPAGLNEAEIKIIAGAVTGYRECGNDFYADQLQAIVARLK